MTLKDVVNGVIIKRGAAAELEDSKISAAIGVDPYDLFQEYKNAFRGTDALNTYTFSISDLKKYTQDVDVIRYMLKNPDSIRFYLTEEQIQSLMNTKRRAVVSNYVELNNYYRTLMGMPNIDWTNGASPTIPVSQEIYIRRRITGVDTSKPLHKMNKHEHSILRNLGMLDLLYNEYKFEWIKYCGLGIDILTLRSARDFDIVYANYDIEDMSDFVSFYRNTRDAYMKTHFNEYFHTMYEYYEPIVCLHLLMTTLAIVNADNIFMKNIEEKDIYTLFESYGLPKFQFSRSYLLKLADKINTLLQNKGTNHGLRRISEIFDGLSIYKYFLVKRLKNNGETPLTADMKAEDKYELFFVRTPLEEDDVYAYMDKQDNIVPFDKMVKSDPLWGFEGDTFEKSILEKEDFTYSPSKYLTLENKINIVTFSIESSYFYRYMLEHRKEFRKLKFYLQTVDKECDIVEVITYLQCLVFRKYQVSPDIPDNMNSVLAMYSIRNEIDYEKVKRHFREHFKWHEDPKFNNIDIDKFVDIVDGSVINFKDALDAFETNFEMISYLYKLRKQCIKREDYDAVNTAIQAITYGEKIPELYNGETNLDEFLVKYTPDGSKFEARMLEIEKMDDKIVGFNNEISEILVTLKEFTDTKKHKKTIDLLDTMQNLYSDVDIIGYLEQIINFFKCYTQDLVNKGFTYVIDDIEDEFQITEKLTRILKLEGWEVVLLNLITNKYNKELVTLLTEGLFKIQESVSFNESVQRVYPYGDVVTVGETTNSYF